jgi:hypothetical protein
MREAKNEAARQEQRTVPDKASWQNLALPKITGRDPLHMIQKVEFAGRT